MYYFDTKLPFEKNKSKKKTHHKQLNDTISYLPKGYTVTVNFFLFWSKEKSDRTLEMELQSTHHLGR